MPMTAISLVLAAGSLWLESGSDVRWRVRLGQALAALIILIALLSLGEFVSNFDNSGITPPQPQGGGREWMGRMAPHSAVGLLLVGGALLLMGMQNQRARQLAQLLALLTLLVTWLGLVGYVFQVSLPNQSSLLSGISLPEAFAFILLSAGIIWEQPNIGLAAMLRSRSAGGLLARRLLPAALLIPLVLGWLRLLGQDAGLFGQAFGVALMVIVNTLLLTLLIWHSTVIIDRIERGRLQAVSGGEEQRRMLGITLASIGDGVIATDTEARITFINPIAQALTGWSEQEALNREITEVFNIVNDVTRATVDNPIAKVLENGLTSGLANSTILIARNGIEYPINDCCAPIRDEGGRTFGAVLVFRDITKRRQAERAILEAYDDLDKRVEQSTAELKQVNAQLMFEIVQRQKIEHDREKLLQREQAAREQAELASRLKDEFLATVSHELRTPLNHILGWLTMVRSGQLSGEETNRALEIIERNARAQNRLVEDLLDVSRVITGRLRLEIRPLAINSIINDVIAGARPVADAKGVVLEDILEYYPGMIPGDSVRLHQVFWNLISNAIKFTPAGGMVRVRLEHADSGLIITISDTGQGISAEFLPHIFDRFRQADASTTRKHGGLGLGLAIVRHLVELHGGIVTAESPGLAEGATFKVTLPTKTTAITHKDTEQKIVEPGISIDNLPRLDGLKVLVVEDEEEMLSLIDAILIGAGAQARGAGGINEALAIFEEWEPDLLLADIGMPSGEGYELLSQVRLHEQRNRHRIPAVALIANARSEDRLHALQAGYHTFIPKPVDPAELIMVLASLARQSNEENEI